MKPTSAIEERKTLNKINKYLRLRTYPLGFKLLTTIKEAEKLGRINRDNLLICQVINMARIHRRALVVTAEDSLCVIGSVLLGLREIPPHMASGEVFLEFGYISDPEKAKKFQENLTKLEPRYKAFAVKPLERFKIEKTEPDLVLIYGNSAQMVMALLALNIRRYEKLQLGMFGEAALCSGIAQAMITGKPQIVLPCFGERVYAGTADDELALILPFRELTDLIYGLEALYNAGIKYPVPIAACATPVELHPVLKPDYTEGNEG